MTAHLRARDHSSGQHVPDADRPERERHWRRRREGLGRGLGEQSYVIIYIYIYVCMYVCMYVCTYVYIYIYIYTHTKFGGCFCLGCLGGDFGESVLKERRSERARLN